MSAGGRLCTHCQGEISDVVWLELSRSSGLYYYTLPAGEVSQGGFPFGPTCGPKVAQDEPPSTV